MKIQFCEWVVRVSRNTRKKGLDPNVDATGRSGSLAIRQARGKSRISVQHANK